MVGVLPRLVVVVVIGTLAAGCSAYRYRPGAIEAGRPHARNGAGVGFDADDAAEDRFRRGLGDGGACVRGLVLARDEVRTPLAAAHVEVRGATSAGEHTLRTRTDGDGRFRACFSRALDRVGPVDVQVQRAGFVARGRASETDVAKGSEIVLFAERP